MDAKLQELADAFEKMAVVDTKDSEPPAEAPESGDAPAEAAESKPVVTVEHAKRGWDLDVTISPAQVVDAASILDANGFAIDTITGVDWMARQEMEVVYDFFHPARSLRVVIRTRVQREKPELPSIHEVFPGANWHERETHEFFGVDFIGHPDLSPLLLPEDATYHPLRKDFTGAA